jgi:hypothetical protein
VTSLPRNRAFLIQLSAETDPILTAVGGRVEHVSSGRSTRFGSRDELWDFVAGVLAEDAPGDQAACSERRPR